MSLSTDDFTHPRPRLPLTPLLIGTALAVVALAGRSRIGAWMRGFFAPRELPRHDALAERVEGGLPLHALRDSILGRRKASVVAACGPPRTAHMTDGSTIVTNQAAFWRADTWYYAVDAHSQTAMAIQFVDDFAREVEFFDAPKAETET